MALLDKIRYWDIWYDRKLLSLTVSLVLVVLIVGVLAFVALRTPTAVLSESVPSKENTIVAPVEPGQPSGAVKENYMPTQQTLPPKQQEQTPQQPSEAIPLSDIALASGTLNTTSQQCLANIADTKTKVDYLRSEQDAAEKDIDRVVARMRRDADNVDAAQEALDTAINASESEKNSMQHRINNFKDDLSSDTQDFHRAEDALNAINEELTQAKKAQRNAERDCTKQDLLSATLSQSDVLTKDGKKDSHIANCAAAVNAIDSERKDARNEVNRANDELDRERRDLTTLQIKLDAAEQRLKQLQDDVNSSSDSVSVQKDIFENLRTRADHQKSDVDDAQQSVQDAQDVVQEGDDTSREIRDVCRTQTAKGNILLQFGITPADVEKLPCADAKSKIVDMVATAKDAETNAQDDLQKRKDDLDKVQQRLNHAENLLTNATNDSAEIARQEDAVQRAQRDMDDAQTDADDADDFLKQVRDTLAEVKLSEKRINDKCGR